MAINDFLPNRRDILIAGSAALAAIPLKASAQSSAWKAGVSLPLAVQEIYPTTIGEWIHLAGGLLGRGSGVIGVSDQHWRWRKGMTEWEERRSLPKPLHHPNLVSHRGKAYALGGFTSRPLRVDWQMQPSTLIYDPNRDEWTEGADAPEPHGETVCAELGEYLHVVGGRVPSSDRNMTWRDHIDSDRHLIYSPGSQTWETAAPALIKRNSAAGTVIDRHLYVVGGRQVSGGNLADLEIYDPREDRWRNGTPMPQAQGGLAASAVGDRLYAFGGEFFSGDGGVYRESWSYDPATDQWNAAEPMPTPRHGLGAVTLGQDIYVIGGAKQVGGRQTARTVEILSV